MNPEEEDNAEALRRIQEAEATGATALDLGHLASLRQLPRELGRLTFLQDLNLSGCEQLRDLGPLAGLTSLHTLCLSRCVRLSDDLAPLAGLPIGRLGRLAKLTSLQELNLANLAGC